MHAEHDHRRNESGLGNLGGCFQAVQVRHGVVQDHHIRAQLLGHFHGLTPVLGCADHFKIRLILREKLNSFAHDGVIIGQQDGDGFHRGNSLVRQNGLPALAAVYA